MINADSIGLCILYFSIFSMLSNINLEYKQQTLLQNEVIKGAFLYITKLAKRSCFRWEPCTCGRMPITYMIKNISLTEKQDLTCVWYRGGKCFLIFTCLVGQNFWKIFSKRNKFLKN